MLNLIIMLAEVLNTSNVRFILLFRPILTIFCLIVEEVVSTKPIHSFLSLSLENYRYSKKKNNPYNNFSEHFPRFYDVIQNLITGSLFCVSSNSFKKFLYFPESHNCS